MSDIKFGLHFSAYMPLIEDQLKEQGLKFSIPEDSKRYQRYVDAVTNLRISGVLTDSESHKANQRIMKKLTKSVVRV